MRPKRINCPLSGDPDATVYAVVTETSVNYDGDVMVSRCVNSVYRTPGEAERRAAELMEEAKAGPKPFADGRMTRLTLTAEAEPLPAKNRDDGKVELLSIPTNECATAIHSVYSIGGGR